MRRPRRTPIIALVVARGENGAIGIGGDLPWRLSTDLKQFRKVTLGKPVIMGRRTFQSLGRIARPPRQHRAFARPRSLWRLARSSRTASRRGWSTPAAPPRAAGVDEIMVDRRRRCFPRGHAAGEAHLPHRGPRAAPCRHLAPRLQLERTGASFPAKGMRRGRRTSTLSASCVLERP